MIHNTSIPQKVIALLDFFFENISKEMRLPILDVVKQINNSVTTLDISPYYYIINFKEIDSKFALIFKEDVYEIEIQTTRLDDAPTLFILHLSGGVATELEIFNADSSPIDYNSICQGEVICCIAYASNKYQNSLTLTDGLNAKAYKENSCAIFNKALEPYELWCMSFLLNNIKKLTFKPIENFIDQINDCELTTDISHQQRTVSFIHKTHFLQVQRTIQGRKISVQGLNAGGSVLITLYIKQGLLDKLVISCDKMVDIESYLLSCDYIVYEMLV